MDKDKLSLLQEPFDAKDIEWRVQQSGIKNDKGWAMVLAYVQNRAVQQRLDDVCGPENWKNAFQKAPDDGVMCGISIKIDGEWVDKWDGAENTQIEAVKGGLSGAMKRSAVQWGIGRYLYNLETTFVNVTESKGAHYIGIKEKPEDKYPKIKGYWNDPKLPVWALPKGSQDSNVDSPATDEQRLKIKKLLTSEGIRIDQMPQALEDKYGIPIGSAMTFAQAQGALNDLEKGKSDENNGQN